MTTIKENTVKIEVEVKSTFDGEVTTGYQTNIKLTKADAGFNREKLKVKIRPTEDNTGNPEVDIKQTLTPMEQVFETELDYFRH